MIRFKKSLAVILSSFVAIFCMGCNNSGNNPSETYDITLISEFGGAEEDLLIPQLREYLNENDFDAQCRFLIDNERQDYYFTRILLKWNGTIGHDFDVYLADNSEFTNATVIATQYTTLAPSFLIPGTIYFWKVIDNTTGEKSKTDTFKVKDAPVRIIVLNGADNVRDCGGWRIESGKTVKYGMIYRGGRINETGNVTNLSEDSKNIFENVLNVKTEIDLRTPNADDGGQTENCVNSLLGYVKTPLSQYTYIFPQFNQVTPVVRKYDERTKSSLKSIFETLSDETNYPIYYHCNAGADRTGTLAFLINGLLGVSYEDLTRDFEITSFTAKKSIRWRGSRENFRDGVMQDDSDNYVAWGQMYEYMMRNYGENKNLSEAIENFLVSQCDIEQATLDKVKTILLKH